jgi:hypothetical protein
VEQASQPTQVDKLESGLLCFQVHAAGWFKELPIGDGEVRVKFQTKLRKTSSAPQAIEDVDLSNFLSNLRDRRVADRDRLNLTKMFCASYYFMADQARLPLVKLRVFYFCRYLYVLHNFLDTCRIGTPLRGSKAPRFHVSMLTRAAMWSVLQARQVVDSFNGLEEKMEAAVMLFFCVINGDAAKRTMFQTRSEQEQFSKMLGAHAHYRSGNPTGRYELNLALIPDQMMVTSDKGKVANYPENVYVDPENVYAGPEKCVCVKMFRPRTWWRPASTRGGRAPGATSP